MTFKAMKFRARNSKHSKMIQMKLFELGYGWATGGKVVKHTGNEFLYTSLDGAITWGINGRNWSMDNRPEMLIKPYTTYNLVEAPVQPKPETVELNGKTYLKADLEAALAKLQPVE